MIYNSFGISPLFYHGVGIAPIVIGLPITAALTAQFGVFALFVTVGLTVGFAIRLTVGLAVGFPVGLAIRLAVRLAVVLSAAAAVIISFYLVLLF